MVFKFRGIEIKKKISWYSRGDYTTGVKDTFACCRSGAGAPPLEFFVKRLCLPDEVHYKQDNFLYL
ncbi:hypothetical protein BIY21_18695 [Vibrio ponticus]|uniref:Uncharacterized protein n=1 Tax=Vibrio ponticus TaxID=265668 RepID=A0ABX3FA76_9VIBR|nr:hypothetical protein BIY21_18695 [Vibrio ponticus]